MEAWSEGRWTSTDAWSQGPLLIPDIIIRRFIFLILYTAGKKRLEKTHALKGTRRHGETTYEVTFSNVLHLPVGVIVPHNPTFFPHALLALRVAARFLASSGFNQTLDRQLSGLSVQTASSQ